MKLAERLRSLRLSRIWKLFGALGKLEVQGSVNRQLATVRKLLPRKTPNDAGHLTVACSLLPDASNWHLLRKYQFTEPTEQKT